MVVSCVAVHAMAWYSQACVSEQAVQGCPKSVCNSPSARLRLDLDFDQPPLLAGIILITIDVGYCNFVVWARCV